jgi:hypothetical protein
MSNRDVFFQQCNEDTLHQRIAGLASWAAFSARWRARQGLPLLHPMDVQYLTPQDFCNGVGRPLPSAEQRRLFRGYVQLALQVSVQEPVQGGLMRCAGLVSADIAFVRSDGFVRLIGLRPDVMDFIYGGREDVRPYESEALLPTRPYGIPTTSATFPAYWINGADLEGDEDW